MMTESAKFTCRFFGAQKRETSSEITLIAKGAFFHYTKVG